MLVIAAWPLLLELVRERDRLARSGELGRLVRARRRRSLVRAGVTDPDAAPTRRGSARARDARVRARAREHAHVGGHVARLAAQVRLGREREALLNTAYADGSDGLAPSAPAVAPVPAVLLGLLAAAASVPALVRPLGEAAPWLALTTAALAAAAWLMSRRRS